MNINIKTIASYEGHNFKANKSVDLKLGFEYSELINYVRVTQLLNENINIKAKVKTEKPVDLGTFMVKAIQINGDGTAKITFNSTTDYVESKNIDKLIGETFNVLMKADIEDIEGDEEE